MMINTEKELLDYIENRLRESGALDFCKDCAERTGGCCIKISPFTIENHRCPYLGDDGCENRNIVCLLYFCTRLTIKFPELEEELRNLSKKIEYKQVVKLPMEI